METQRKQREFASITRTASHKSLLVKFGIISNDLTASQAFNAWTRISSDLRLQTKTVSLESALAAMSGAELRALKLRVERWPRA